MIRHLIRSGHANLELEMRQENESVHLGADEVRRTEFNCAVIDPVKTGAKNADVKSKRWSSRSSEILGRLASITFVLVILCVQSAMAKNYPIEFARH